jgi:hypothetical protein
LTRIDFFVDKFCAVPTISFKRGYLVYQKGEDHVMRPFGQCFLIKRQIRFTAVLMSAVVLVPLAGCSGGGGGEENNPGSPQNQHIMLAAGLVGAYQTAHKGQVPPSAEALKTWAQGLPKGELEKMKISNLDDVLVSPRDKEPYQIAPPPKGRRAMGPPQIVVYEKTGVRGMHKVAGGMGTVRELETAALNSLLGK